MAIVSPSPEEYQNNDYKKFIPKFANIEEVFDKAHIKTLETLTILKLRQSSAKDLSKYYDYNEGIEYRIKEMADKFSTLDEIKETVATPRYRIARINKLLLYPLLEITKSVVETAIKSKPAVKVLAINKQNMSLLKTHNKNNAYE